MSPYDVFVKQAAIVILGIVSAIFAAKYSARIGAPGIIFGIVYCVVFVGAATATVHFAPRWRAPRCRNLLALAVGGLSLVALVAVFVVPSASRVGRLPAVEIWLSDLLAGTFPYHAPNQPSGFPMLFLAALPAYALGNVGLLEVVGIALFGAALLKWDGRKTQEDWVPLVLLLLLPSVYYEVIVRSELFFNITLVLALIIFTDERLARGRTTWGLVGFALLFGLVLSTRSVIGLVYGIYVIWRFRHEPLRGMLFTGIVLLTFALTLVPFLIWNPGLFVSNGPFSIQFGYLPLWIVVLFLGVSIYVGFVVRGLRQVLFACGVLLFALVFTAFLFRVGETGLSATVLADRFDIAYFVFCTPFLLLALHERRN